MVDPRFIVTAVVVILVLIGIAALFAIKRRKTTAGLRRHFGAEYDQAVLTHGSEHKAEAKLADRETRVENLKLRELGTTERERFLAEWQSVQSRFVDHPKTAVTEADELVSSLMQARGYPVSDFDQRAADISVNHPRLVESYRSAHGIAVRVGGSEASTEDLRTAMIHYRTLFDDLMQAKTPGEVKAVA